MEFFLKYKTVLFRFLGLSMLLVALAIHFWQTPKKGVSEVEAAAANVARMEASVATSSTKTSKASKPDASKFIEELKSTQEKQMQYLTIIVMLFGLSFLIYSFVKPKK